MIMVTVAMMKFSILGGTAESDSAYCDSCYRSVVCPSVRPSICICVCMSSVTLVHPVKAVVRSEMPFGRDTHVVASGNVIDRDPGLPSRKGTFGGRTRSPSSQRCGLSPNYLGHCYS